MFDQCESDLRCEWGLQGLVWLAPISDVIIVVDILSFSTAVDIAVSNGAFVLPARWKTDAIPPCRRSRQTYSLSPASLRAIPAGTELVLPSPNGSTLCLSIERVPIFTACLRNAPAVAAHVAQCGTRVAVIPAGERWSDGTLRPCLEDCIGAGAILSLLPGSRSPEAEMAVAAFEHFRGDLQGALLQCGSGRELVERGFRCDVELAAEFGVSSAVPRLAGDRFLNASRVCPG
jgi:2-phosphosulfolactate phosphatase